METKYYISFNVKCILKSKLCGRLWNISLIDISQKCSNDWHMTSLHSDYTFYSFISMQFTWYLIFRYGEKKETKLIRLSTYEMNIWNEATKKMHNLATSSWCMKMHKRISKIKTVGASKFGECLLAQMSQSSKSNSLRNDFMTWLQGNSVKVKHLNLRISLRKVTHQVAQLKHLLTSFWTISRV